jgi:hypothetical protein
MRRSYTIWFAAALAAVTAPATATAQPSVVLDRACYQQSDSIIETGSGFAPRSQVTETWTFLDALTGAVLEPPFEQAPPPVTTDARGRFRRSLLGPQLVRGSDRSERVTSTFTDQANPVGKPAVVGWTLTRTVVKVPAWRDRRANPRQRMLVDTFGWAQPGATLWAFYYFRDRPWREPTKRVRIGRLRADDPCGRLRKRVRQFPFRRVRQGIWGVYFTTSAVGPGPVEIDYISLRVRVGPRPDSQHRAPTA